ncbi:MAG: chromosomal replication initiator protein DnaA [Solirubrobacteraceae bacterium]
MALPAQPDPESTWRSLALELRRVAGDSTYEVWLARLRLESFDGRLLTLRAPGAAGRWMAGRFGPLLERCAHTVLGAHVSVTLLDDKPAAQRHAPAPPADVGGALNPRYRFEQFVIGAGNQLAHAAALAVAELPGQAYNPLFLHARPGLGKTHLLHAIGNYVQDFGGGARVRYTTAEAFTNHFMAALGSRSTETFKRAYRDVDVLLIDDIQFLAEKARTEEEFFHTFNSLYETGRQLVLTCDRLPQALVSLEQRLRERFEAGLVADISSPDHATRVGILRKRAALDGVQPADPDVLELIAGRVTDNVRILEGALIRVVAFHSLTGRPLDRDLTLEVLDRLYPSSRVAPTIAEVQAVVATHFHLSVPQLTSSSRAAGVAWPRHVAIHLARELTGASLPKIGQAFGGRNHATVLHACRRVSQRMRDDAQAVDEIVQLAALVGKPPHDRG